MNLKKQISIILIFTILPVIGIVYISWKNKHEYIDQKTNDFQSNQLSYVGQLSDKVQMRLTKLYHDLYSLSQRVEVQFLKKNTCMLNMIQVYRTNQKLADAIYRVDVDRKIRYAYPRKDCPVAGDQLDMIFEHCRLTGQSLYRVVRQRNDGSDYLVIALPVYTIQGKIHLNPSNKFSGIIFFTTTLDTLQQYFFLNAKFGKGRPYIIDENGLHICTTDIAHRGKKAVEFLPNELPGTESRNRLTILEKMIRGESGIGQYSYRIHNNVTADFIKLIAYKPLYLPDQRWAIAISNPMTEVVSTLNQAIQKQRLYTLSLFFIIISMAAISIYIIHRNHTLQMGKLLAKEKENSLIRKEWSLTFDAIDSMIVLLDREANIVRANKTTAGMCNLPMTDILGESFLDLLFDESDVDVENPIMKVQITGRTNSIKIKSNKLSKLLLLTVLPIDKKIATSFQIICYAKDITEIEEMQAQLNRAQKMESIGLMAGGVAHDLNNILSGIVGYPDLLLIDLPADSVLREPIEAIQASGKRASEVVADLLTVARGVAAEKVIANLNDLVGEYLDSPEFQHLKARHPNILCTTEFEKELLNTFCSPTHIKKCIMNLITNAAEAIVGNGQIVISTVNRYIDKPLAENQFMNRGEYVILSITDTGSGLLEKDVERIFEPFYTKKVMERSGTGLGLSVVWNTVKDHDGGVTVNSSEKGTTFDLFFHAVREELTVKTKNICPDKLKGNGEKVLVVDDESQQRDLASRMLTALGYNAHSVVSGEEALAYLNKNHVDLVLLDMIMDPGINGRRTYEQIIKIHPGQKAIITSGFSETEEIKMALRLGVSQFIKKPYMISELCTVVHQTLFG